MSTAVKCPKCKCDTLHTQPEPTLQFDRCEKCKGTWLDGGELAQFANLKNDLPNSDSMVSYEKKTSSIALVVNNPAKVIPCTRSLIPPKTAFRRQNFL